MDHHDGIGDDRYGVTNRPALTIKVVTSYGYQRTAVTLLHEILHTIYYVWDLSSNSREEDTVYRIGQGLAAVWRDNPEVMAWIHRGLSKP
jgi:hypothetical protein